MKTRLQVVAFNWPGGPAEIGRPRLDRAQAADEAGFDSLWVMDHYFQMESAWRPPSDPMLEAYTALGYLAGKTERLRLRAMVTGVTYRHPGDAGEAVTTLDVLSGGRAELGIGAAWYERERSGLGVPFPPLAERFERLEEALQIASRCGAGNPDPSTGSTTGWRSRSAARSRSRSRTRGS